MRGIHSLETRKRAPRRNRDARAVAQIALKPTSGPLRSCTLRPRMNSDDWKQRWVDGRIGFHESSPNTWLVEHVQKLTRRPEPPRVLVPLCGKSRDLAYLASRGCEVVGAELSPIAARAFFAESGIEPETSSEHGFEVLRGGGVSIYVGDFFALDPAWLGTFDGAYDRAALVAIAPSERAAYASKLFSLLAPAARVLLVTFEYDASKMEGPPFSLGERDVRELFGARCTVEKLGERDALEPRFVERGLDRLSEGAFLLEIAVTQRA